MLFECPLPVALESLPEQDCPVRFDQIVRMVFQMVQPGAGTFTDVTIKALATWTPLLAASDSTKVVPSPLFAEMVIPQSEALTIGGNDNTTFNGIPLYNGEGNVLVTLQVSDLDFAVKKVLTQYSKYSIASAVGTTKLSVYFINKDGVIISNDAKGFPAYNFRISSVGSEGFNAANKHAISFNLLPNWDNDALMSIPSFDPLTAF